jgi:hypothetical protein
MTKSSRELDPRDVSGVELESPRDIRGGRGMVTENAPACREVHVGAVITNDLDAPPSLLADDAVNLEAPHVVLVCEQKSDFCARAVGAFGDRIPRTPDCEVVNGVREACFDHRALSGQEPPVEDRLLTRKDLIARITNQWC